MKTPEAFRGISEVAEALGVRQHTLRAWELRFPFIKPVKRSDGRRYYRPSDIELLAELRRLLTDEKRSAEDILRSHREGGLLRTPAPSRKHHPEKGSGNTPRLRVHRDALTAVRTRLASILGPGESRYGDR